MTRDQIRWFVVLSLAMFLLVLAGRRSVAVHCAVGLLLPPVGGVCPVCERCWRGTDEATDAARELVPYDRSKP